jgi:hypothetical protein
MHPLLQDPWIAAQVEAAVAPYIGRLPDGEVTWMRDQLAETLATDEHAQRLLRRAKPTVVAESGEVERAPVLGDVVPIAAARRPKAAG